MSWSKILTMTTVVLFVFGIAMIDCAVAGEKVKSHGANYTVKWEQIEVGDEEGHVVAVYQQESTFISRITGETKAGQSVNTIDINLKTEQGNTQGYLVTTDKDGDKTFRTYEGKSVGKGHWQGTWAYVKGTGKYEGIKGEGTWDSDSLAQRQSFIEVEGEVEMPIQ